MHNSNSREFEIQFKNSKIYIFHYCCRFIVVKYLNDDNNYNLIITSSTLKKNNDFWFKNSCDVFYMQI